MNLLNKWTSYSYEVGCDEVGRGCLCGPVVAAAVILPEKFVQNLVNDSKKLTFKTRQYLDTYIKDNAIEFAIAEISAAHIDEINILNASIQAMHRALDQLKNRPEFILVDGGLYANTVDAQYRNPSGVILPGVYANGNPNTTEIGNGALDEYSYYGYQPNGYGNAPNSEFIFDASYVKLREASISYSLPKTILSSTFLQDVTLSLVGRNLWIIHKNLPYADPEAGVGGGLRSRGNSIGVLPTTRDFGFNVNIKF